MTCDLLRSLSSSTKVMEPASVQLASQAQPEHGERDYMRSRLSSGFIAIVVASFVIVGTLAAPKARADEYDKKTIVTFNEPVEVPGMIIPAGTYVFKLVDIRSDRRIVRIFNSEETRLITTVDAIPDERVQAPTDTNITFDERPAGQPEAVHELFYPGQNEALEFVYPKEREVVLKQGTQQPMLLRSDEQPDNGSSGATDIATVAPAPEELAAVAGVEPDVQPQLAVANSAETELPQTASPLGSIAMGGVLGLVAAFGLRRFSGAVVRRP
jgi:hypothetical protein